MTASTRLRMAAIAAALVPAGFAAATPMEYSFTRSAAGTNNNAGTFESVSGSFNEATNRFTWSITFSNQVTEGFSLAVNPGGNPKGHGGEMALLYFSWGGASETDVQLSAYAYNGLNSQSSYLDGDRNVAGNQTPDFIFGTETSLESPSWLEDARVVDTIDGKRTMSFSMDATAIQNHVPLYPDNEDNPTEEWSGVAFGSQVGFWLHTFKGGSGATYGDDGLLDAWSWASQGWWDTASIPTQAQVVPLPPAAIAGILGLAGAGVLRRRRA